MNEDSQSVEGSPKVSVALARDAITQIMHQTYMDLIRLATNPECWDASPEYTVTSPWQGSNMQSIFVSIYDVPVEKPPYNRAAFAQLIDQYKLDVDYDLIFSRFDAAYRKALDIINAYRRTKGLQEYPSPQEAKGMLVAR